MRVVAFISEKVGSGKTSLIGNLAVQAERTGGGRVVLVDTDPQGGLAEWAAAGGGEKPACVRCDAEQIFSQLKRLAADGYDIALIDTPPTVTSIIAQVVSVAELVVIVTAPSPKAVKSAAATTEMVEHIGRPFVFVLGRAKSSGPSTGQAVMVLCQHGTITPTIVHHHEDFITAMNGGRTVMDLDPHSGSSQEIAGVWSYLNERLEKLAPPEDEPEVTEEDGLPEYPIWVLNQDGKITVNGAELPCTINEISADGALVAVEGFPESADRAELSKSGLGRYTAEVTHRTEGTVGLKFVIDNEERWRLVRKLIDFGYGMEGIETRDVEVMLVMPEGVASHFVERELRECGYHITTVESTLDAIPAIIRNRPDLVLISAIMPDLGGIDLAIGLRAMPATRGIATALITSLDPDDGYLKLLPMRTPVIHKSASFADDLAKALSQLFII
ncbi:MAG: hypothetical protein OEY85_07665 [Rhodospirillales bacterium]|nr:hypothetical protein [Rhodospirillales bacterium]